MRKRRNPKLKSVIHNIIKDNEITDEQFDEITESPYKFTKEIIEKLSLQTVNEEEFNKLETNFMYKFIGKLFTDYRMVKVTQNRVSTFLNKNKWKK